MLEPTQNDDDDADYFDEQNQPLNDQQEDEEHLSEIARDQAFMSNLDYIYNHDGNVNEEILEQEPGVEAPRGFLALKRGDEGIYVRKPSVLWMLTKKSNKTPTDRLHRFELESRKQKDEHVMCGDFIYMKSGEKKPDRLCQVLGFKFRTGNPRFTAMSCPIKIDKEKARGVDVLCNFFSINNKILTTKNGAPKYVDFAQFSRHATIKRDLNTNDLILL